MDPGASNGLIGSETLRDMVEVCVPKKEKQRVQWNAKTASVSGISGAQDRKLGEVTIPVSFGQGVGTFTADVLGGEGSLCPALHCFPIQLYGRWTRPSLSTSSTTAMVFLLAEDKAPTV